MKRTLVIWDQDIPENMKWNLGDMGLVSSSKSFGGQCWNVGKGGGGSITQQLSSGGIRTICVDGCSETNGKQHCGIAINSF